MVGDRRLLVDGVLQAGRQVLHHLVLRPLLAGGRHHARAQALDELFTEVRIFRHRVQPYSFEIKTARVVNEIVTLGTVVLDEGSAFLVRQYNVVLSNGIRRKCGDTPEYGEEPG